LGARRRARRRPRAGAPARGGCTASSSWSNLGPASSLCR